MVSANIEVKSLVVGPMPLVAKVPLPGKKGLVSMPLQFLGNGHFLVGQVVAVLGMKKLVPIVVGLAGYPVGDVDAHGMSPGHDAGTTGPTQGLLAVSRFKPHSHSAEPIQIWRLHLRVTTKMTNPVTQIVHRDEEHIRWFVRDC